jgi:hypothetical protein
VNEPLDLPYAWGVLYAPPNPDGSKKKCENCFLWIPESQRCAIHATSVKVTSGMVCGYHVHGRPSGEKILTEATPVDPKLSGLEDVSDLDGTSCGSCMYYDSKGRGKGLCFGVAKTSTELPPQPVQELGCCSRWERP